MQAIRSKTPFLVLCGSFALAATLADRVSADDARSARSADMKRRIEEHKRKVAQHRQEVEAKLGNRPTATSRPPTPKPPAPRPIDPRVFDDLKRRAAAMRSIERPKAPPFNAARAPAPEQALAAYVAAARRASSMEPLLGYLPTGEANSLKEHQATHDPALAATRRDEYRREGRLDEGGIAHLTNPPYTNALIRHRAIAEKTLSVLRVRVDGAKAEIEVSTTSSAVINGARYPYSTATYELVGEGSAWKIASYNDGNVYYQDPPAKRPPRKKEPSKEQATGE